MAKRGGQSMAKPKIECLPINMIHGTDRPLLADRLRDLIESIKAVGLLNPIIVRNDGDWGGVWLIAGAHRIAAAKALGYRNIMVRFINCTKAEAKVLALHEDLAMTLIKKRTEKANGKRHKADAKPKRPNVADGVSRGRKNRVAGRARQRGVEIAHT